MPFSLLPEIPDSMWNYWWLGERNVGIFAVCRPGQVNTYQQVFLGRLEPKGLGLLLCCAKK
jgi:hypothetical protein